MSNPVSLYVADTKQCLDALKNLDEDADEPPLLRDCLDEFGSDVFTHELAELFDRRREVLADTAAEEFLRIILWSWLDDGEHVCGIPEQEADAVGLDFAITPDQVAELSETILSLDADTLARRLFADNEVWESRDELSSYLDLWVEAFREALESGKGVFFKVWI